VAASHAAMGAMGGSVSTAGHRGQVGEHGHERPVDFGDLVDEGRRVGALLDEWAGLAYTHPRPKPDEPLYVPLFYHVMQGAGGTPAFDSGPISPGGSFMATFGAQGVFTYHCQFHPMQGTVNVVMGAPPLAIVTIENTPDVRFNPQVVSIAPGGQVRWDYPGAPGPGAMVHTVTEDAAGMPSYCFNGRAFVGNTPTIVAEAGQRIRWYVFDLDLSMAWHNFHPHAARWQFADQWTDVRSIGPAESFWVETTAPPVLLLPPDIERTQPPGHRPKDAKEYRLRGDFLVHCHVEMHMMGGMVGLVRSLQTVWLTDAQADELVATTGLPIDDMQNTCPDFDMDRCALAGCGRWEEVPDLPGVTMMHAALIPETSKVMFFGYGDIRTDLSRIWDYSGPGAYSLPPNQPADVESVPGDMGLQNIWSAEHAYDANGVLLVHGGFTPRESYLFDPISHQWSRTDPTAEDRFYSTTLTLADGRLLTLYGSSSLSIEVYNPTPGTWDAPIGLPFTDYQFYPWTYLLPGGDLFIAGPEGTSRRFDWTATPIGGPSWPTNAGNRDMSKGQKGTSVLLPLRAPGYEPQVLIAGGDTVATQSSSEIIDLSAGAPAWSNLPNLNVPRPEQVNTVLLPDGRVFLAGGVDGAGGPAEIFDPQDPMAGWLPCASMTIPRGYHSSAILLVDGSVLMGGDRPGAWKSGETTPHERYYPSYCLGARPSIGSAPASVAYGSTFTVSTPDAASIGEAVLLRPGAVTHGFNMSQRFVGCQILARNPGSVDVLAPPDGNVAPPGYYLLFLVDGARVPSTGRWIRVLP